jgi:hypothetical protein
MLGLAPEDKQGIKVFANGIRTCIHLPMPVEKPRQLYGPTEGSRLCFRSVPKAPQSRP